MQTGTVRTPKVLIDDPLTARRAGPVRLERLSELEAGKHSPLPQCPQERANPKGNLG